jgi:transcriptional regulator with XRE-family HTH domain
MGIRQMARLTRRDRGYLSRLERGLAGAREDTIHRIAGVLGVLPADITKGDPVSTQVENPSPDIPDYWTDEGQRYHYTPEQVAAKKWIPCAPKTLRRKASAGDIPHHGGGRGTRITLTGKNIAEINEDLAIRPLAEQQRPRPRPRQAA